MQLSATSITGNDVHNANGDNLGHIEDLMIDTRTGVVSYAVLSFGGFMGFGNKLFAVPLQAMRVDTENKAFVLDVPKERLENAPGFDKDQWPAPGDVELTRSVQEYYHL